MVLGCGAAAFGGVVTAAGLAVAAGSGRSLQANLTVGGVIGYLVFVLPNVPAGVALGALLQNSAGAIAASFALPADFAALGPSSKLVSDWIDMSSTWNWVLENEWAGHVTRIAFSIVFWVVVPLARRCRLDATSRGRIVGGCHSAAARGTLPHVDDRGWPFATCQVSCGTGKGSEQGRDCGSPGEEGSGSADLSDDRRELFHGG